MAVRIGSSTSAARTVRRALPVLRDRWVRGGLQVRKVFPESEGRWDHKVLKESLGLLVPRGLWVKQVRLGRKDPPV